MGSTVIGGNTATAASSGIDPASVNPSPYVKANSYAKNDLVLDRFGVLYKANQALSANSHSASKTPTLILTQVFEGSGAVNTISTSTLQPGDLVLAATRFNSLSDSYWTQVDTNTANGSHYLYSYVVSAVDIARGNITVTYTGNSTANSMLIRVYRNAKILANRNTTFTTTSGTFASGGTTNAASNSYNNSLQLFFFGTIVSWTSITSLTSTAGTLTNKYTSSAFNAFAEFASNSASFIDISYTISASTSTSLFEVCIGVDTDDVNTTYWTKQPLLGSLLNRAGLLGMYTLTSTTSIVSIASTNYTYSIIPNAKVTFIVPYSGSVRVRLRGVISNTGTMSSTTRLVWGLTDGINEIAGASVAVIAGTSGGNGLPGYYTAEIVLTGLTPGSTYTVGWHHRSNSPTVSSILQYGNESPGITSNYNPAAVMEVWAA